MEAMRKTWTDDRLDDMNRRMENGFRRVDEDIRSLRGELGSLRTEINTRFERVEDRIDDINRTMLRLGGGAIATFVVGFAGLIATQL